MSETTPPTSAELQMLLSIVQRLEVKVDIMATNAVTRTEFESLRSSMESFLLKREFELFRESHETWSTMVLKQVNDRLDALEEGGSAWKHAVYPTLAIIISMISAVAAWTHHL